MLNKFQIIKYGLSGVAINTFGFIFYIILIEFFNLSPIVSLLISFPIINGTNYLSQSLFVFKKKISIQNLKKYISNVLFLYLLNILLLFVLVNKFNFNPIVTQFFTTIFLILLNFFYSKKVIFK